MESAKGMLIANLYIGTADKDHPLTLPAGCKRFRVQCRDATALRMATVAGGFRAQRLAVRGH